MDDSFEEVFKQLVAGTVDRAIEQATPQRLAMRDRLSQAMAHLAPANAIISDGTIVAPGVINLDPDEPGLA